MRVVAYFRRNTNPLMAAEELAVQRRSVADWLTEKDATLVAELTETETDGKARPAFGKARHLAKEADAVILVATTKAIGPRGRFNPASTSEIPHIHAIEDPGEVERQAWSRSRSLVLYQRRSERMNEADRIFSLYQRDRIAELILPSFHTVLAEFVEDEPLCPDGERPALEAALALCREKRARLVIGTTDAFGGGHPFEPAFTDVPFEVAFRAADRWLDFFPAPDGTSGMPIALHFSDHQVRNRRPIYLVNRTGTALHDVAVTRSGWTLAFGGLTQMNPSVTEIPWIDDDLAWLVGSYELAFDSDFIVSWHVTAKDEDGRTWSGGATLDKGGRLHRPLPLLDWQVATQPDAG